MATDGVVFEWLMGSGVLAVVGLSIATYREVDKKINRTFERLDEVKKATEEKYTNKDICKILHEQIRSDLSEIKSNVKTLVNKQNE